MKKYLVFLGLLALNLTVSHSLHAHKLSFGQRAKYGFARLFGQKNKWMADDAIKAIEKSKAADPGRQQGHLDEAASLMTALRESSKKTQGTNLQRVNQHLIKQMRNGNDEIEIAPKQHAAWLRLLHPDAFDEGALENANFQDKSGDSEFMDKLNQLPKHYDGAARADNTPDAQSHLAQARAALDYLLKYKAKPGTPEQRPPSAALTHQHGGTATVPQPPTAVDDGEQHRVDTAPALPSTIGTGNKQQPAPKTLTSRQSPTSALPEEPPQADNVTVEGKEEVETFPAQAQQDELEIRLATAQKKHKDLQRKLDEHSPSPLLEDDDGHGHTSAQQHLDAANTIAPLSRGPASLANELAEQGETISTDDKQPGARGTIRNNEQEIDEVQLTAYESAIQQAALHLSHSRPIMDSHAGDQGAAGTGGGQKTITDHGGTAVAPHQAALKARLKKARRAKWEVEKSLPHNANAATAVSSRLDNLAQEASETSIAQMAQESAKLAKQHADETTAGLAALAGAAGLRSKINNSDGSINKEALEQYEKLIDQAQTANQSFSKAQTSLTTKHGLIDTHLKKLAQLTTTPDLSDLHQKWSARVATLQSQPKTKAGQRAIAIARGMVESVEKAQNAREDLGKKLDQTATSRNTSDDVHQTSLIDLELSLQSATISATAEDAKQENPFQLEESNHKKTLDALEEEKIRGKEARKAQASATKAKQKFNLALKNDLTPFMDAAKTVLDRLAQARNDIGDHNIGTLQKDILASGLHQFQTTQASIETALAAQEALTQAATKVLEEPTETSFEAFKSAKATADESAAEAEKAMAATNGGNIKTNVEQAVKNLGALITQQTDGHRRRMADAQIQADDLLKNIKNEIDAIPAESSVQLASFRQELINLSGELDSAVPRGEGTLTRLNEFNAKATEIKEKLDSMKIKIASHKDGTLEEGLLKELERLSDKPGVSTDLQVNQEKRAAKTINSQLLTLRHKIGSTQDYTKIVELNNQASALKAQLVARLAAANQAIQAAHPLPDHKEQADFPEAQATTPQAPTVPKELSDLFSQADVLSQRGTMEKAERNSLEAAAFTAFSTFQKNGATDQEKTEAQKAFAAKIRTIKRAMDAREAASPQPSTQQKPTRVAAGG